MLTSLLATPVLRLAAFVLVLGMPAPSVAYVSGRLHINAYNFYQTLALVPDDQFIFHEPSDPSRMLTVQQGFNDAQQPPQTVFSRSANATMDGSDGALSAYVDVELDGIPSQVINNPGLAALGIYSEASLFGSDFLEIKSSVLSAGAQVETACSLDVLGNGRVVADFNVFSVQTGGGQVNVLNLGYYDAGNGIVTGNHQGSFMAVVGGLYHIEYTLTASGGVDAYGMNAANQTKFKVSDYSNAHFYVDQVDPQVSYLKATSGHDYSQPVPEPSATLQMMASLLVLGQRLRRRARANGATAATNGLRIS